MWKRKRSTTTTTNGEKKLQTEQQLKVFQPLGPWQIANGSEVMAMVTGTEGTAPCGIKNYITDINDIHDLVIAMPVKPNASIPA